MNRSLQNNIRTIYTMGFFHSFIVVVPVFVPLLQGYGLTMSQVLQTQAIFALTTALCEVPSGYIADVWGRRPAILLGSVLNGLGFLSLLWADGFVDFLVYEAILGVGFSLISGADLALLYDTEVYLQERGLPGGTGAGKSLSRLISVEAAAAGVAGIVASLMLLWSLEAVVILQAVVGFAPLLLGLALIEVPRRAVQGSHREHARRILALLLFDRPVVLWTALAICLFGVLGLYIFWSYQKYWEFRGIPLAWYGYIWAAFALTVSLAARYTAALEQHLGTRALVCLIAGLPLVGLLGMACSPGWIGVLFGFANQVSRGMSMSLFYEALNKRVPGDFRATVNSLVSLGIRGLFIATGPLLGIALDYLGIRDTLLLMAAVFAPLMTLVLLPLLVRIRRERHTDQLETAAAG